MWDKFRSNISTTAQHQKITFLVRIRCRFDSTYSFVELSFNLYIKVSIYEYESPAADAEKSAVQQEEKSPEEYYR